MRRGQGRRVTARKIAVTSAVVAVVAAVVVWGGNVSALADIIWI